MATELTPESADTSYPRNDSDERHELSGPPHHRRKSGRRWARFWLTFGVIAVAAPSAVLIPDYLASHNADPRLTHTISRGDLLVTVTEQGTLESSNNTEIKCEVRGFNVVTWVIEGGTYVEPGDELVRLDTKRILEEASLGKTNSFIARATYEQTKAEVAKAEIAIDAYLKGRYRTQLKSLEKQLAVAQRNLLAAQTMLQHSKTLFKQGYVTELEVEGNAFTVTQAELELKVKETEIDVLQRFTREMQLETLRGNLKATKSKLEADKAGLEMDESRRDRAIKELESCIIKADRSGMVIYPSAAAWKDAPDIAEGQAVRKDQVLLLMPDLSKMQIKVGIHESVIDRVRPGLTARVTLPEQTLQAEVSSVASVTTPAGWWTGNVVKYDTIIKLPSGKGLKPGMSAEVEVVIARHENVLKIPVAAVLETDKGAFCWLKMAEGSQRRPLKLGDSNDVHIIVESGLKEGDEVILNPVASIEDAKRLAANTIQEADQLNTKPQSNNSSGSAGSGPEDLFSQ